MGWWQVNADTLAGSRFVISPFAEAFACLQLLHRGTPAHPGEQAWLRDHLPGYRARLAADPVTALLVRAGLGRSWIADFLTPTPRSRETFEEGVARVRAARPDEARANLRISSPARFPRPWTGTTSPSARPAFCPLSGPRPYGRTGTGAGGCWRRTWSPGPRR